MTKARLGLIGTGFMARAHAACFAWDGRVSRVAVCSRESDRARAFAMDYGFLRPETDWRRVVEDSDIDIVDITVPNYLHGEIAVAAAEAGKNVILEKPLAMTMTEADGVMEAIRRTGVLAMYAENRRFAPVFLECRQRIAAGEIGEVRLLRINEMGSGPGHTGWFRDPDRAGGGALIDLGIHGLGLAEWLVGSAIVSVSAMRSPAEGTEETVTTSVRFATGSLGQFVCSWEIRGGLDIRVEIYGSKGTLMVDHAKTSGGLRVYRSEPSDTDPSRPHSSSSSGWSYPPVDEWNVKGHRNEMKHFMDCHIDGIECRSTFQDGYRALQLAHGIYRSAKEGREIPVEPA